MNARWFFLSVFAACGFALLVLLALLLPSFHLDFLEPVWLLLLLALKPFTILNWKSLGIRQRYADDALTRRRFAFGLRVLALACVALALAEPRLSVPHDYTTVLFVLDRSLSVPEELDDKGNNLRWLRVRKFMNDAVRLRPRSRSRDQVGLIAFGRRPRLEALPGDAPRFNLKEITSLIDGNATDIASALQLALASFPPNSAKRIVLLSDGNENRGNASDLAAVAKTNDVEIDVVPLGVGRRKENEVLVERVDAPIRVARGEPLPLKVWVRSFSPRPVRGTLIVKQINDREEKVVFRERVELDLGINPYPIRVPPSPQDESYTYEAEFQPEKLEGDRPQNNRAATHVLARGRRRVLLLEAEAGSHQKLLDTLHASGPSRFQVESRPVEFLERFSDAATLTAWLSNFDCVMLANIPADRIPKEQQEALKANTHDQGCGLVMIGGPESYGAGGWQNTPVEEALPVNSDIDSIETDDRSGLVLVMHASEMAEGNMWQKKIAKLAIERLGPRDHVGILHYDFNVRWHIPMTEVGTERSRLLRLVDRLEPGDMPDFDPALQMAHKALTEKARELARKHVIVISDGDPNHSDAAILGQMRRDKVTVTTVGVATHGAPQDQLMQRIASATRGKCYLPKKPDDLPAIYIKETRLLSQSFLHEKPFDPQVRFRSGPTAGLPERVPKLNGFVRTKVKPNQFVDVAMKTSSIAQQEFPLLASWQYGLGKAVAFTSDAGEPKLWCREWAVSPLYGKFWEQIVDWSLRPVESNNLTLTANYRSGRIKIIVEARNEAGDLDLYLRDLKAQVSPPRSSDEGVKKPELTFEQKSPGVYEAEMSAEDAGSYFIAFQAKRRIMKDGQPVEQTESVRGSVTVPFAAEFADLEANPDLLEDLRTETGGLSYRDDDEELARVAREGTVFRAGLPGKAGQKAIWPWFVFAASVLLLFDVALRRLALERLGIGAAMIRQLERMRGKNVPAPVTPTLDRLQTRKAKVNESLASRRIDPAERPAIPPTESKPSTSPPSSAPRQEPKSEPAAPEDYLSRLQQRKKRIQRDRGEDKETS